jgi:hypothetical protein
MGRRVVPEQNLVLYEALDRISEAAKRLEDSLKVGILRPFTSGVHTWLSFDRWHGSWRILGDGKPILECKVEDRIRFAEVAEEFVEEFKKFHAARVLELEGRALAASEALERLVNKEVGDERPGRPSEGEGREEDQDSGEED